MKRPFFATDIAKPYSVGASAIGSSPERRSENTLACRATV
jgi:hypothetical protein